MNDLYEFQITKYNNLLRKDGYVISSEWSEFWDVGKVFNGVRLTLDEYYRIENIYVDVVLMMLEVYGSKQLKIVALSLINHKHKSLLEFSKKNRNLKEALHLNTKVTDENTISDIIRLGLRSCFGDFQIEIDSLTNTRLSFSYHMYIFLTTTKPNYFMLERIHDKGLFVW